MHKAQQILNELSLFLARDSRHDHEKEWMLHHCSDDNLKSLIKKLQTRDLNIIKTIALGDKNIYIKKLPALTNLSQPTISRSVTLLTKLGILNRYHSVENNKDILVQLTDTGEKIAVIHAKLRQNIIANIAQILSKYPNDVQSDILDFLININRL